MLIGVDASRATAAQRTGTEAYAYHLIGELLTLTAGSEHCLRLYYNQPPADNLFPGFPHVEPVVIPFRRLWTHVRLAAELHRRPPDVFFTPAHVIPISYFGRSVATVHDLGYRYFPEAHTRQQVAQLEWSTRHNAHRSRLVFADSQATKDDLVNFYRTNPTKIYVVYPGLTHLPDQAPGAEIAAKLKHWTPYLLFLSTIQPRKNIGRIVQAFATIAAQIPHKLILAGKVGWNAQPILQHIDQLPAEIKSRIILPGFIPDGDKAAVIREADLFLYPSLYEGFGFPLLEANACGTAVLASYSSSLPELAGNDAALLVNPQDTTAIADGILQLLQDNALRQTLVANGYQNVQRFQWPTAAKRVLELLLKAGTN